LPEYRSSSSLACGTSRTAVYLWRQVSPIPIYEICFEEKLVKTQAHFPSQTTK
jgi:hypothetical protein